VLFESGGRLLAGRIVLLLYCVRMQTSTEKKQSGIEVGVRAIKKKRSQMLLAAN